MSDLETELRFLATEFARNNDGRYSGWFIYLVLVGLLAKYETK